MTDKAYIVANEQQEREVLGKLEHEGLVWNSSEKPTEFVPSHIEHLVEFPYALLDDGELIWCYMSQLDNQKIVYDGRKEEQMSDKYVVSQEFMNELKEWKARLNVNGRCYVFDEDIYDLPSVIETWWKYGMSKSDKETNNRLIAIIRWVNGEDVFEVEKPKKWVVRSKELSTNGEYHYGVLAHFGDLSEMNYFAYDANNATKFDTKEEAQSWANAHQEVVEV